MARLLANILKALLVLALAVAASVTWPLAANAQQPGFPPANRDLAFLTQLSGKCLDADTNTANRNPTIVQLWDCNNSRQQTWRVVYSNSAEIFIINSLTGKCLDANPATVNQNGGAVYLWSCNYAYQQVWRPFVNSESERTITLRNGLASGVRVLDADSRCIRSNGCRVQMWDSNLQPQQIFQWNRY